MPQLHTPSTHHADELSDANSQPTPSVRVQSPTDDKPAPGYVKPVATRYSPPFGKFCLGAETESDPTVLLNSTHSLLAWPQLTKKPQKLAFGVLE